MNLPTLLTKKYRKTTSSDGYQVIGLSTITTSYLKKFCTTKIEYFGEFVDGERQSKTTNHIDLKAIKKELGSELNAIKIGNTYISF